MVPKRKIAYYGLGWPKYAILAKTDAFWEIAIFGPEDRFLRFGTTGEEKTRIKATLQGVKLPMRGFSTTLTSF